MNRNLKKAKDTKNDEFYTRREDIDAELPYYHDYLKDKVVYCNCDSRESNFVQYFLDNFDKIGLKDCIYTNTDFRRPDNMRLMREADVIITNPPFSIFRDYFYRLLMYQKKFLVVGSIQAAFYKHIFPLIRSREVILGVNKKLSKFDTPHSGIKTVACYWYTNMQHGVKTKPLELTCKYDPAQYPRYDNYNAIEVSKVKDIPYDYEGEMGVPIRIVERADNLQFDLVMHNSNLCVGGDKKFKRVIVKKNVMGVPLTFIEDWNEDQFELVGVTATFDNDHGLKTNPARVHEPFVDNKGLFRRLLIQRKSS